MVRYYLHSGSFATLKFIQTICNRNRLIEMMFSVRYDYKILLFVIFILYHERNNAFVGDMFVNSLSIEGKCCDEKTHPNFHV